MDVMKTTIVPSLVAKLRQAIARTFYRAGSRPAQQGSQSCGTSRIGDATTTGALCPDHKGQSENKGFPATFRFPLSDFPLPLSDLYFPLCSSAASRPAPSPPPSRTTGTSPRSGAYPTQRLDSISLVRAAHAHAKRMDLPRGMGMVVRYLNRQ